MTSVLDAALDYARSGFKVIPTKGKAPWFKRWTELATTDKATIQRWWKDHPQSNVGICPDERFCILDVDHKKGGEESVADLERKFGPLPEPPVDDVKVYTPAVMRCPADDPEMAEAHSYIINDHLRDKGIKFGSNNFGGKSSSEVVVMGEKRSDWPDYYMNSNDLRTDFPTRVEPYRHGVQRGSNYLFLDLHVDKLQVKEAKSMVDPWDVPIVSEKE